MVPQIGMWNTILSELESRLLRHIWGKPFY